MLCQYDQSRLAAMSITEYQRLVLRLFRERRASTAAWYEMARAVTTISEAEDTESTEDIDRMVLTLADEEAQA